MLCKTKLFVYIISILFILSTHLVSSNLDDLVKNLPDYPYGGRIFSGYLKLSSPIKKLHYLFVESQRDRENDPLILWLNGGPGCSSLLGWAQEHGPAIFKEGTTEFELNPYSWNKLANVLYLESPAGVGFSTIESEKDYDWTVDDVSSGKQNLEALLNFFKKYPNLRNNDLYISGESYAGIYVPMLVSGILNWNKMQANDNNKINLKGMIVGNGVTDWNVDTEPALIDFGFTHSLYSYELRQDYLNNCEIKKNQDECDRTKENIMNIIENVNIYDIYRKCFTSDNSKLESIYLSDDSEEFQIKSKFTDKYNYTPWLFTNMKSSRSRDNQNLSYLAEESSDKESNNSTPCVDSLGPDTFFNREDVKAAMNVDTKLKWELCSDKVGKAYKIDRSRGSYFLYPKIISAGIKILVYSGDTDGAVPFNGTQKWISNLKLPILSKWKSWRVDDDNLAGYRTVYKGLTFVVVKGTGHMVPQWKPKEAYYMLSRFLEGKDL
jgi:serine carboxypeptidase-like clade I